MFLYRKKKTMSSPHHITQQEHRRSGYLSASALVTSSQTAAHRRILTGQQPLSLTPRSTNIHQQTTTAGSTQRRGVRVSEVNNHASRGLIPLYMDTKHCRTPTISLNILHQHISIILFSSKSHCTSRVNQRKRRSWKFGL